MAVARHVLSWSRWRGTANTSIQNDTGWTFSLPSRSADGPGTSRRTPYLRGGPSKANRQALVWRGGGPGGRPAAKKRGGAQFFSPPPFFPPPPPPPPPTTKLTKNNEDCGVVGWGVEVWLWVLSGR